MYSSEYKPLGKMVLVCYYPGKCVNCPNTNKLGWNIDSTFMCCACHDILEYSDTRHGEDKITNQPKESIVLQYIPPDELNMEEQFELPGEIFNY